MERDWNSPTLATIWEKAVHYCLASVCSDNEEETGFYKVKKVYFKKSTHVLP